MGNESQRGLKFAIHAITLHAFAQTTWKQRLVPIISVIPLRMAITRRAGRRTANMGIYTMRKIPFGKLANVLALIHEIVGLVTRDGRKSELHVDRRKRG
jgi:hypothetical protein